MKKCIISLALLTLCFASFSQKTFTQATLKGMLEEYKRDSKVFFTNRLSSDFRGMNPEGKHVYRSDIIAEDAQKIVATDILKPVIFQSCDLGIVNGLHKTTRVEADGSQNTGQVACTYTFQRRKGKWMFVASQQTAMDEK